MRRAEWWKGEEELVKPDEGGGVCEEGGGIAEWDTPYCIILPVGGGRNEGGAS